MAICTISQGHIRGICTILDIIENLRLISRELACMCVPALFNGKLPVPIKFVNFAPAMKALITILLMAIAAVSPTIMTCRATEVPDSILTERNIRLLVVFCDTE